MAKTFPVATTCATDHAIGATQIAANGTTGFAASGSLTLEPGTVREEVVTYTSIFTGVIFLGISPPTAFAHADGSTIVQTATGGRLAGAASL